MKYLHGQYVYESEEVIDRTDGYSGIRLYRVVNESKTQVASVFFWDAMGQYMIGLDSDLPLDIVQLVIAEAKRFVGVE